MIKTAEPCNYFKIIISVSLKTEPKRFILNIAMPCPQIRVFYQAWIWTKMEKPIALVMPLVLAFIRGNMLLPFYLNIPFNWTSVALFRNFYGKICLGRNCLKIQ
ncbi:hypothetical protein THIOM_001726 [Candidatus Thiomargarita nelsonii]|uniref:Uncharacterized protein n=1 Tax=Candidatus Thiomargarita nelsonii TaxID=1003181 RepID=A0A176S3K1_9GAMM|nr:hypothetical protein THIOM_001726 [Candidatus Thiomargarita nelsonii]